MFRCGIKTEPSSSSIAVRRSWLPPPPTALAQSHRNRSSPMDSPSRRSLAVVEEFPCRRSSCPSSTILHCRLFSKMKMSLRKTLDSDGDASTHRYFHVDFDGFSLLKSEIELSSRLSLFFLTSLFILHVLEVILKGDVEVERVRSILESKVFFLLSLCLCKHSVILHQIRCQ